jgi:hypothetical protein
MAVGNDDQPTRAVWDMPTGWAPEDANWRSSQPLHDLGWRLDHEKKCLTCPGVSVSLDGLRAAAQRLAEYASSHPNSDRTEIGPRPVLAPGEYYLSLDDIHEAILAFERYEWAQISRAVAAELERRGVWLEPAAQQRGNLFTFIFRAWPDIEKNPDVAFWATEFLKTDAGSAG